MLTYVLPIVLFIITLIIILAFRAEDKKSRSLQTVKEKISSFRSESQQTMARISEACGDAKELVESKKKEMLELVGAVEASLDNLNNHRKDLTSLESVCRGYELALDKLRVQTEHAEDRIRTVQNEVEKARSVDQVIQNFRTEVASLQQELSALTASCSELIRKTSDDLDEVARSHKEKADAMLLQFSDMLSSNREDFGSFIDDMRDDISTRHADFKAWLDTGLNQLDEKKEAVLSESSAAVDRFQEEKSGLEVYISNARSELDSAVAQVAACRQECAQELEKEKEELVRVREENLADAANTYAKMTQELIDSSDNLRTSMQGERTALDASILARRTELEDYLKQLGEKTSLLEQKRNEMESDAENIRQKADEAFTSYKEKMDELASSSQTSIASSIIEGEQNLSALSSQLKNKFETDSRAVFDDLDKAKEEFSSLHKRQQELISSEEEEYSAKCRTQLAQTMDGEISRVSAVFDSMFSASTEQLANFAKKLTEIREAVSMLNQGVSESLSRTGEKLTQIHTRLASSEASLSETQNKVTAAKEELFNLQRDHKNLQEEVAKAQKELDWLQSKAQSARRDRQNEEARLARLQMENARQEKNGKTDIPAAEEPEAQEEELPIDDD